MRRVIAAILITAAAVAGAAAAGATAHASTGTVYHADGPATVYHA